MSDEKVNEFLNKQRMKTEEIVEAPIIGLEKWRIEHGLTSPEMEAYIQSTREQKAVLVVAILILTVVVNYLRYGVP